VWVVGPGVLLACLLSAVARSGRRRSQPTAAN
jgi:hypothetical protein